MFEPLLMIYLPGLRYPYGKTEAPPPEITGGGSDSPDSPKTSDGRTRPKSDLLGFLLAETDQPGVVSDREHRAFGPLHAARVIEFPRTPEPPKKLPPVPGRGEEGRKVA